MSDAELIAQARAASSRVVRGHLNPAMVERAVLVAVAGEELADRTWKSGFEAGEAAREEAARLLRERHGALNPRRGWLLWPSFLALLAAALAAVSATGLRIDPQVTAPLCGLLGLAVAVLSLVMVVVAGRRPLNAAFVRAQVPTVAATGLAAGLMLARAVEGWAALVAGGAVIALVVLAWIVIVRRRDPEGTRDIDTALQTAYADAAPVVAERAARAQREAEAALGPDRAAQTVRVRTAVLRDLAHEHPELADVASPAPAGGVIIQFLASRWLPLDMTEGWQR